MEKKTALFDRHVSLGGRMVPFAGFSLPVHYPAGIIAEHHAVRRQAGLFDVSHMGEFVISGKDALANLQNLLTRDIGGKPVGRVLYSPLCNESGGVVDDVLIYLLPSERYLLVVNAANREKDADWIRRNLTGDVRFTDESDTISQIALQGPKSQVILEKICSDIPLKYYTFIEKTHIAGADALLSRTGYTGEDGFEIYLANEDAPAVWDALLTAGRDYKILPCGLGARDTLRLEAALPLYGHEMDETVLPCEAGLGRFVNMEKERFIGRAAILSGKDCARTLIGLLPASGIAREGAAVYAGGREAGVVTSGTHAPALGHPVCLARVESGCADEAAFEIAVRGRMLQAKKTGLPFYKRLK